MMTTKDQSGSIHEVMICVRFLKVDDATTCIEVTKIFGDQFRFLEHFNKIKNELMKDLNDAIIA